MAAFSKPASTAQFDTNQTNSSAPDAAHISDGWVIGEKPPAEWFNYQMFQYGQWLGWLNERLFDGASANEFVLRTPNVAGDIFVIDSTGRVFIKQTVSDAPILEISGGTTPSLRISDTVAPANEGIFHFTSDAGVFKIQSLADTTYAVQSSILEHTVATDVTTVNTLLTVRNGDVGVGVAAPSGRFHVSGTGADGGLGIFESTDDQNTLQIKSAGSTTVSSALSFIGAGRTSIIYIEGSAVAGHGDIVIAPNGVQSIRCDYNNQNVGINVTNPTEQLHVVGGALFESTVSTSTVKIQSAGSTTVASELFLSNGVRNSTLYMEGSAVAGHGDVVIAPAGTESIRFDHNNQNVGINIAEPTQKLHVVGIGRFESTTGQSTVQIQSAGSTGIASELFFSNGVRNSNIFMEGSAVAGHGDIVIAPAGTESLRCDHNNQNVGINITEPTQKLHVVGIGRFESTTGQSTVQIQGAASPAVACELFMSDGVKNSAIQMIGNATPSDRGDIVIAPAGTEAARFKESNQAVSFKNIGTTASAANAFLDGAANNNLLRSTSSARYKKHIEDLTLDSSLLYDLRPVEYDDLNRGTHHIGLVAEEVAKIEPLLVQWSPERCLVPNGGDNLIPDGVQYPLLSVLLVKELKNLRDRIEALEG